MSTKLFVLLAALVLVIGSSVAIALPAHAQEEPQDCEDFPNQAAAQAALRADPSDPAENDADGDGIACELFQYADATTDLTPVPAAVTAGAGGAAPAAGAAPAQVARAGVGAMAAAPLQLPPATLALLGLAAACGALALRNWRRA